MSILNVSLPIDSREPWLLHEHTDLKTYLVLWFILMKIVCCDYVFLVSPRKCAISSLRSGDKSRFYPQVDVCFIQCDIAGRLRTAMSAR